MLDEKFFQFIENNIVKIENSTISNEDIIRGFIGDLSKEIRKELEKKLKKVLLEKRKSFNQFVKRNINRWSEGFDVLETMILICTEAGEINNDKYRKTAVENNDLLFDILIRHHSRACLISNEILTLLKNGFADGAHARWRALHEVNVTGMFISKYGKECAERFYFHNVVDSYDGMIEHKKFEDRLNEKALIQKEIDECKKEYDKLILKYGKKFGDHYGWASYIFPNRKRVSFTAIEKDVELDHMRPYYKLASQNIHAGSKGLKNRLGLCESNEDILLVGQSNSGMVNPADSTAISLAQITITVLMLNPTIENIILMKVVEEFIDKVGETFLKEDKDV